MVKTIELPCSQTPPKLNEQLLLVAKIGRTVGLLGGLRLQILSDFPHIFKPKAMFHTDSKFYPYLEILRFSRGVVDFVGFTNKTLASKLTNIHLFCTAEESRAMCHLSENEFLWSDIIGAVVLDDSMHNMQNLSKNTKQNREVLGIVVDIERIGSVDYLHVQTDEKLLNLGFARQFLIPNIPQYVTLLSCKYIFTHNAKLILQES